MTTAVMAATAWRTNAEMIQDVVALGYIRPADKVIDLTFGRGAWWAKYDHPGYFVAVFDSGDPDLDKSVIEHGRKAIYFGDYREMGFASNTFDVVTFDPPYVSMGGRSTSGLPDFMDRYGLKRAANSPKALHEDNARGLSEAARLCRPGGFVMTKCAGYVSSGQYQPGDVWIAREAEELGLIPHDRLIHVGNARAQPPGRRQVHSRNNYSVLWVFKKPKARKKEDPAHVATHLPRH